MIVGLERSVQNLRGRVADIAALRWARLGPVDPIVPVGIAFIAVALEDQLGRPVGGVPFGLIWVVATAVALAVLRVNSDAAPFGRSWSGVTLVAWVVVGWLLFDLLLWQQTNHLYDLNVYLGSAGRWVDGGRPYMSGPVTAWPASAGQDFFLYPPPLLPVFGFLSRLPNPPVSVAWVGFLAACAYAGFRALGLRPTWSLLLLTFPPVMIGFESGNVASLTFLLFALAFRAGGGLVLDGLFKVQSAIPALWLVRTGRRRGLGLGLAALAAIVLLTLPVVGIGAWQDWIAGLGYRAASQQSVASLFGFSYARYLPGTVFAAVSIVSVGAALLFTGRRGLAALGLASIVASPSLWPHGFVFALPAILMLESGSAVWIVLGLGAVGLNMWLLVYAGWVAVVASRRLPDALHPMAGTDGPWPNPNPNPNPSPGSGPGARPQAQSSIAARSSREATTSGRSS